MRGRSAAPAPFRRPLPAAALLALVLLLPGSRAASGEDSPTRPDAPAPAVSSPPAQAGPLSPEGLLALLKGKHKTEVRDAFAVPDRMTDLHRHGDRVYGDGAEVKNLYASGQWLYGGEKAARVVDPATGRKAASLRVWFDPDDRAESVEIDWKE